MAVENANLLNVIFNHECAGTKAMYFYVLKCHQLIEVNWKEALQEQIVYGFN